MEIESICIFRGNPLNGTDRLGLYESSPWLCVLVPGQVTFDHGMTAWENGNYGQAGLLFGAMLGEQALTVASLGTYRIPVAVTAPVISRLSPVVVESGSMCASNVANGPRLANQLLNESARSPFTVTGTLTNEAIMNARAIPNLGPGQLTNPAIPAGVGKYTTETYNSIAGNFQVHFYMNPQTKTPFYGLDYNSIFNHASGASK